MSTLGRTILIGSLLVLTVTFNVGLVEVRIDEIGYLIGKAAVDEQATKTFGIVAKYELIKRRMLYGEDDIQNYELEARVAALTSTEGANERKETGARNLLLKPVRGILNLVRVSMGSPTINPVGENRVLKVLEIGYFWERNRKYPEAIKIYDEVLEMSSLVAEVKAAVMAHKAFCHSMMSEYKVAKEIYERVISTYPETQAGVLSWRLLDFIETIEKEREELSQRAVSDFERARQFYMLMDYRNSIKYFSTFLQGRSSKAKTFEARYYKGRSHEELGETEEATSEYYEIIRNDKSLVWARQANRRMIMIGEFYENKKQMAEEARRQLSSYQDEGFISRIDQLSSLVSESSLRDELIGGQERGERRVSSAATDSLLEMLGKMGNLDLTGEEAAKRAEELERRKEDLIAQGKISASELKELERIQTLRRDERRRPTTIKRIIDENASQLKYLYNKHLRTGTKLQGQMLVEIRIRPDGKIGNTRLIRSTMGDEKFEGQILKRVATWQFAVVPDSLGEMKVNYPFEFHKED